MSYTSTAAGLFTKPGALKFIETHEGDFIILRS